MSRWDYDSVLYRVFCITLLAVAFTFTVILTNVFIDIDGLLYKKDKVKPNAEVHKDEVSDIMNVNFLPDDKSEDVYDDKDYQDSSDLYRSKRALEASDFLLHVKDPKLKKVLTNRLALLLDELDENESAVLKHDTNIETDKGTTKNKPKTDYHIENTKEDSKQLQFQTNNENVIKNNVHDLNRDTTENAKQLIDKEELIQKEERIKIQENEKIKDIKSDEMGNELLHLAMHNMVLQGIIGNMNLDNVYNKVADLVKNFEHSHDKVNKGQFGTEFQERIQQKKYKRPHDEDKIHKHAVNKEVLLDEPKRLDHLTKDLHREETKNKDNIADDVTQRTKTDQKENHVMITTIIDITALANDENNKETDKNLNVNGVIKLIYNGKMFKFKRIDDDITSNISTNTSTELKRKAKEGNSNKNQLEINWNNKDEKDVDKPEQTQKFYKKMLQNYLKTDVFDSSEHKKLYSKKRLKRHVKIRFDNHNRTAKPKHKNSDDELFVEIETHIDGKGAKGEKKKRLIQDLIKKIEKAIHSDNDTHKKKHKHWHVKKRIQDPLSTKHAAALINKLIIPLEKLAHRHSNPISKAVALHDDMPLVSDDFGQTNWHSNYMGPRFFGKAINSAEMSTVDIDYNKVMKHNGIPQRLQKPLNTDISDEVLENSKIYDLGDMKFLMKDIDGTGFTIGFNQYTDEAPDLDTMKLFSGLEAIIQTYHQKYDQQQQPSEVPVNSDTHQSNSDKLYIDDAYISNDYEKSAKPNEHQIERRSIREPHKSDHHSSEYKYILKQKFLPYHNYQDIYNNKISKENMLNNYKKEKSDSVLVVDENVLERDLKPGEILSLANLLQRRKRALNVQKITNVRVMNNLNRYLNTKTMATKSFFRNKRRHKRQIGKIRIVARDTPHRRRNSEEEFLVLSDEKLTADRAVLREMELPEIEHIDKMTDLDHYDIIEPQKEVDQFEINNQPMKANEDHFDIVSPYTYELSHAFDAQSNEFSRRARHNNLMAKYPHIFLEETIKEDGFYTPISTPNGNVLYSQNLTAETTTQKTSPRIEDYASPYAENIVKLLQPPQDLNDYRVSVKIRPKNTTGMSGYKEVHTSINKSYNKNGLVFTSLVNVSQLSKVEKIHKNASDKQLYNSKSFNHQKNIIQSLILQHKNRIDEQLRQLLEEREKLENIHMDNTAAISDTIINTPFSAKFQGEHIDLSEETVTPFTEASTTMVHTNTAKPTTVMPVTEQMETLKMVTRDENITNQILKKMDQNTGVLQTFLGKLIEKIDMSIKNSAPDHYQKTENNETSNHKPNVTATVTAINYEANENKTNKIPFDFEEYYKNIHNAAFKNMPRQGNFSGIPFIYAYQQPLDYIPDKKNPVASVMYHGLIHAKTDEKKIEPEKKQIENYNSDITATNNNNGRVQKDQIPAIDLKNNLIETDFWKAKQGEKVLKNFKLKNNSKFFMDESGHDFKMYSPMDSILVNSTKV